MEIRNCLYRGSLNNVLKELASLDDFHNCINQKGLDKRMSDRSLALRFLAFYQMTYTKARKGLKAFFNEFFTTYRNAPEEKLREFRNAFKKAMKVSYTVFGDKAFRLRRSYEKGGGEWTPRINATVFQVVGVSFTDFDTGQLTRAADSIFEAYLDLITTDEKWIEAVTKSTDDYAKIEYSFSSWNERLRSALSTSIPNDGTRFFSRTLKEEMFN